MPKYDQVCSGFPLITKSKYGLSAKATTPSSKPKGIAMIRLIIALGKTGFI